MQSNVSEFGDIENLLTEYVLTDLDSDLDSSALLTPRQLLFLSKWVDGLRMMESLDYLSDEGIRSIFNSLKDLVDRNEQADVLEPIRDLLNRYNRESLDVGEFKQELGTQVRSAIVEFMPNLLRVLDGHSLDRSALSNVFAWLVPTYLVGGLKNHLTLYVNEGFDPLLLTGVKKKVKKYEETFRRYKFNRTKVSDFLSEVYETVNFNGNPTDGIATEVAICSSFFSTLAYKDSEQYWHRLMDDLNFGPPNSLLIPISWQLSAIDNSIRLVSGVGRSSEDIKSQPWRGITVEDRLPHSVVAHIHTVQSEEEMYVKEEQIKEDAKKLLEVMGLDGCAINLVFPEALKDVDRNRYLSIANDYGISVEAVAGVVGSIANHLQELSDEDWLTVAVTSGLFNELLQDAFSFNKEAFKGSGNLEEHDGKLVMNTNEIVNRLQTMFPWLASSELKAFVNSIFRNNRNNRNNPEKYQELREALEQNIRNHFYEYFLSSTYMRSVILNHLSDDSIHLAIEEAMRLEEYEDRITPDELARLVAKRLLERIENVLNNNIQIPLKKRRKKRGNQGRRVKPAQRKRMEEDDGDDGLE